jgi:predicted flap endonuclease-1-like 5' DNA nuclease
MGKYLDAEAPREAVDLYLRELTHVERDHLQPETLERLTAKASALAELLEGLLSQFQALASGSQEQHILLCGLLKQLPSVSFEPVRNASAGRVIVPLENVVDLLINFDVHARKEPAGRAGSSLLSMPDGGETVPARAVTDIVGIGPAYSTLLRERANVCTTDDLLARADSPSKRAALAEQTGISRKLLVRWVRRADLMRIDGVSGEYGELLECAGLASVAQLARRSTDQVYDKLRIANATRQFVGRMPAAQEIRDWIEQARVLDSD